MYHHRDFIYTKKTANLREKQSTQISKTNYKQKNDKFKKK